MFVIFILYIFSGGFRSRTSYCNRSNISFCIVFDVSSYRYCSSNIHNLRNIDLFLRVCSLKCDSAVFIHVKNVSKVSIDNKGDMLIFFQIDLFRLIWHVYSYRKIAIFLFYYYSFLSSLFYYAIIFKVTNIYLFIKNYA